jgi:ribosomal protein S18 acetylase RimI-like enzyme
MILIFFIIIVVLCYLIKNTRVEEYFDNSFTHPPLVNTCFSNKEIDSFKDYYTYSKIIYGKKKQSLCYLTPTNVLNDIPILSWNGYYINNFCVDKKNRRKGYGTDLLTKIIKISQNEQKDHLILQVEDNNESAKQLYYKLGFGDYFKGVDEENNIKLFLVKYL